MTDFPRDADLAAMLSRAADDPERIAWASDPANQALLDAYQAFQSIDTDARDDRAAEVLAAALRRDLGTARRRRRPRIPRGFALAASVVVMIGGGLFVARSLQPPDVEVSGVLRGDGDAGSLSTEIATVEDGRSRVSWSTAPDVKVGDLVLLDDGLREVVRVPTGDDNVTLEPMPGVAFYVLEFRRAGGETQRTPPRAWR